MNSGIAESAHRGFKEDTVWVQRNFQRITKNSCREKCQEVSLWLSFTVSLRDTWKSMEWLKTVRIITIHLFGESAWILKYCAPANKIMKYLLHTYERYFTSEAIFLFMESLPHWRMIFNCLFYNKQDINSCKGQYRSGFMVTLCLNAH